VGLDNLHTLFERDSPFSAELSGKRFNGGETLQNNDSRHIMEAVDTVGTAGQALVVIQDRECLPVVITQRPREHAGLTERALCRDARGRDFRSTAG